MCREWPQGLSDSDYQKSPGILLLLDAFHSYRESGALILPADDVRLHRARPMSLNLALGSFDREELERFDQSAQNDLEFKDR